MIQSTDSPIDASKLSAHAHFAALTLRAALGRIQDEIPALKFKADINTLAPITDVAPGEVKPPQKSKFKVGIVGAGVAGLFAAMIFDHLNKEFELDVEYEILEARKEHVGGRLFTYKFDMDPDPKTPTHQYYDVGAMRFPDIPIMDRTFKLFKFLGMNKKKLAGAERGDLIPYYMNASNTPLKYNDRQIIPNADPHASPQNPFDKENIKKTDVTANAFKIDGLPQEVLNQNASAMVEDEIFVYKAAYQQQTPMQFWKLLMKLGDQYSVRQYLRSQELNYNTIEFLETLNFGNRWYDQAFSEMVLESLDFGDENTDWRCVLGGSTEIAQRMWGSLLQKDAIKHEKRVTAMKYLWEGPSEEKQTPYAVQVTISDEVKPREYDAVFNSAPLGAQQQMALEGLNLNWGVKQAIRSLGYGASCKVGIQFKSLWWMQKYKIFGGVAKTDLPLRCCVYPSYNIEDKQDEHGVLLVSYTWSQEAERIGALIKGTPKDEGALKAVLLHDLARLHTDSDKDYEVLLEELKASYITHHAYNWYSDEHQVGAFAYFGPGQYSKMWPELIASYGKYMIIGEAASAHHAWVVGSLESAVRGVYQFLGLHKKFNSKAEAAYNAYNNDQIKDGLFGPLPAEFNRTNDVKMPQMKTARPMTDGSKPSDQQHKLGPEHVPAIGDILRQQALFEKLRLRQGEDVLDTARITEQSAVKSIVAAIPAYAA